MEYFDLRSIYNKEKLTPEQEMWYESISKSIDGKISKELAEKLIKENSDPNYTILIHRTSQVNAETVFHNGVYVTGGNNLSSVTDRYENNIDLISNVVNAASYKSQSNKAICVIMKVPNTALNYVPGKTKPILMELDYMAEDGGIILSDEHQTTLLPEYILGAIEYEDKKIIGFKENENYRDIHDYQNDGLVFPRETIEDYKQKNNIYAKSNSIFDIVNEITSPEYKEQEKEIMETISRENKEYEQKNKKVSMIELKENAKKVKFSKFKEIFNYLKNILHKDKQKSNDDIERT